MISQSVNNPADSRHQWLAMTLQRFQLGPWTVEVQRGSVIGPDGTEHHLEPKVMQVLACLAEQPNEVVSRQHLLNTVWGRRSGSDEQLTRAVGEIRRAFQDNPVNPAFVATIPKRGYRLIGSVRPLEKQTAEGRVVTKGVRQLGVHAVLAGMAIIGLLTVLIILSRDETTGSAPNNALTHDQSIAVLPFVNISDDPGNEYFADGITEEILNLLTTVPDLRVIGRTSSFAFKDRSMDLREIGQRLGVRTILEGSVRKFGDRVRIVAQLIDTTNGSHIWSESYDRTLTDIFAVQEEVASAVISALRIHVTRLPGRGRPTESWLAYSAFLQARAAVNRLKWRAAADLLDKALRIDPDFALPFPPHRRLRYHCLPKYKYPCRGYQPSCL